MYRYIEDSGHWLPDYESNYEQYFWTELFVKWINGFKWESFVEYGCEEKRRYDYGNM